MFLKNIVKNKEHMKKIGLNVLVILIFFTGIGYLLLNSSQMQEYDKYLEIRNQDIEILNSNYDEWNDNLTLALDDNQINQDEFDDLLEIGLKYELKSSEAVSNSSKFKNFIENNEISLKISGIDTSDNRETLLNDIITFERNNGNVKYILGKLNSMREQAA
jgi:hypothetical protein